MSDNYRDVWFAYGFRTEDRASEALNNAIADGELSPCEHPRVEKYPILNEADMANPHWRYGIRVTI